MNNRTKRNEFSRFAQEKKRPLSNDNKKQHKREDLHKHTKFSERDAQNFGIAFGAAWKAAN